MCRRIKKTYSAGAAPIMNAMCQPNFGISRYEMQAATSQPTPQKLSSSTINLPRKCDGAYSLMSVAATGSSPPKPKPTKNLNTSSDS